MMIHPDRWTPTVKKRETAFGDFSTPNLFDKAKNKAGQIGRSVKSKVDKVAERKVTPYMQGPVKYRKGDGQLSTKEENLALPHPTPAHAEQAQANELKTRPKVRTSYAGDPRAYGGGPETPAIKRGLALITGPTGQDMGSLINPKLLEEVKEQGFPPPADPMDMDFEPTPQQELVGQALSAPIISTLEVGGDALNRLGGGRRNAADNPYREDDDPVYRYVTPENEEFTSADLKHYFSMGDGEPVTDEFLNTARAYKPEFYTHHVPGAELASDGKTWVRYTHLALGDEKNPVIVPVEDFENRTYLGQGISPDYIGPELDEIWRTQINENKFGTAVPRAPLQDRTNKWAWEPGFDPKDIPWDEQMEWYTDLSLGSSPYYVPGVRYGAGAARALPYALGYEGETGMGQGVGLDNVMGMGNLSYNDKDLNVGQAVGGTVQPMVEAWAEYGLSDTAVGGAMKLAKVMPKGLRTSLSKTAAAQAFGPLGRTLPAQVVAGGLTEGFEEILGVIPGMIAQDGLGNLGRDRKWNDKMERWDYGKGDFWTRAGNVGTAMGEAFASGAAMGLPMSLGGELLSRAKGEGTTGKKPYVAPPQIEAAPRADGQSQSDRIAAFRDERAR
jgi:hypothetical protein